MIVLGPRTFGLKPAHNKILLFVLVCFAIVLMARQVTVSYEISGNVLMILPAPQSPQQVAAAVCQLLSVKDYRIQGN